MKYSDKVIDHFMNPHNVGEIENADAVATEGSPSCGDQVTMYLKVNPETLVIEDIKFKSYGCASNVATASILTDLAKGKTLQEAMDISWKETTDELGGLPPVKVHCSVLSVGTLRAAIKNYMMEHGLMEVQELTKRVIVDELKHVIHPQSGEDIITMKLVRFVELDAGIVSLSMNIPSFDPQKEHICDEIREILKKYTEIKEIKFSF